MVGGELRLVELARGLPRLGDGRHGQVVRGEIPQVCQLRLTGLIVCIIGNFRVYGGGIEQCWAELFELFN